ncbi:MAG: lipopolysaccharide biosynthesis protein [Vicinamibacterales bacterium]
MRPELHDDRNARARQEGGSQDSTQTVAAQAVSMSSTALDRALVRGVLWTSGGRYVVQAFTWASSLVVARILSPADYGVAGVAWLYVGLAQMLAELGIGTVIVQKRAMSEDTARSLATLSVAVSAILAAFSVPIGMLMARFYAEPALTAVVIVYGLNLLVSGIRSVPTSLLSKQLDFGGITKITVVEGLCAGATSVTLGWLGFGVWALVLANVAGNIIATGLVLAHRPCWPLLRGWTSEARSAASVGRRVLTARLAWYAYSNADFAIVGRLLGTVQLGYYTLGWQLATLPSDRLTAAFTQVMFPVAAAAQDTPGAAKRYFLKCLEALVFLLLPISLGGAILANEAVVTVLGSKWEPAAPVLAVLLLTVPLRVTGALANQVILAQGNATFAMKKNLWALFLMPPAFVVGAQYGIIGVALVWLLAFPLVVALPSFLRIGQVLELGMAGVWAHCSPYVYSSALTAAALFAIKSMLAGSSSGAVLGVGLGVGLVSYLCPLVLGWPERVGGFLNAAHRAVRPELSPVKIGANSGT